MRALYTILLFALPSLVFAQNLANDQTIGSEMSLTFQNDPFTSYMMHEVDNPCKDYSYLSLQKISQYKMSENENTALNQKAEACQDFISRVKESSTSGLGPDNDNGDPRQIEVYTYYVFGGCAIALAVIFLLAD